jgi:ubiquinone/menaquinone biosynthesis C-methylase UbiE
MDGMADKEYEYHGMMASAWDLLRGDTSAWPDRSFYRAVIDTSGQPVLDVGCGTGRLLLDYLADGIDVDGVDNSPEMLALCRAKAQRSGLQPRLFLQAMEELALPRAYRTIIVPSSSFQLVTDSQRAAEVMRRFFAHLAPGGMLVMPFMILWTGQTTSTVVAEDWKLAGERARPEDGALIRRWSRSTYYVASQLEHTEDRYELLREGVMIASEDHARSPATRWYSQEQAVDLYRDAGFTAIRLMHEFSDQPADPASRIFSVFGTKP